MSERRLAFHGCPPVLVQVHSHETRGHAAGEPIAGNHDHRLWELTRQRRWLEDLPHDEPVVAVRSELSRMLGRRRGEPVTLGRDLSRARP